MKNKIILGIDPGINITGVSIIKFNPKKKKILILKLKEIYLKKYKNDYIKKMKIIYIKIKKLIKKYNPTKIIMESTYLGKNVHSMRRLIQSQSSILFAAIYYKKKIIEYYPKTIKFIITGYGNSKKIDIKNKLEKFLNINLNYSKNYDFIDSLAVGICYILKKYKDVIKIF